MPHILVKMFEGRTPEEKARLADAIVQAFYRRWEATAETDAPDLSKRRIGAAVFFRAAAATWGPVAAVLAGGSGADHAFLGLMACLLLCVAVAQGSLSPLLFWMSGTPVLIGLTVAALTQFPPLTGAALLLAVAMLTLMLLTLSGGISHILGEWSDMRERNNRLIERLLTERAEAEEAREAARRAIRANSIAPGVIETAMAAQIPESVRAEMIKNVPLARFGTSGEIANTVLFLCSPLASYITGQSIEVNGGWRG